MKPISRLKAIPLLILILFSQYLFADVNYGAAKVDIINKVYDGDTKSPWCSIE